MRSPAPSFRSGSSSKSKKTKILNPEPLTLCWGLFPLPVRLPFPLSSDRIQSVPRRAPDLGGPFCHGGVIRIERVAPNRIKKVAEIENLYPEPENFEAIKRDIGSRGIQTPLHVTPNNQLLSGYTRLRAATELQLPLVPVITVPITDHKAMIRYAVADNANRRHLSKEARGIIFEHVKELLQEDPTQSDRQVARQTGVSHTTVAKHRGKLEESGDVERLPRRKDSLGREQPVRPRMGKARPIKPRMGTNKPETCPTCGQAIT